MYNQDPHWLIPSVLLASDRVFYHQLMRHHGEEEVTRSPTDTEEKIVSQAALDYQFYFGGHLRKEDIQNNMRFWQIPCADGDYLKLIAKLADDFLVWRGNCFEVRRERLEAWSMLCSVIDPAWIIAKAYAQLHAQKILSEQDIVILLTENQCPFAFPGEPNGIAYADNHVHFNGHGYTSMSMLSFIDNDNTLGKKVKWPYRQEYTFFESQRLKKNDLPKWMKKYSSCLLSSIFNTSTPINYAHLSNGEGLSLHDLPYTQEPTTPQQRILKTATQTHPFGHQRWLLFCCGLMMNTSTNHYPSVLINLIRVCNILRNYMVVSAVGLGQFVDYFDVGRLGASKDNSNSDTVDFDNSVNINREYRVSPTFVLGNKNNIYHHKLTDFFMRHDQRAMSEQAHIVVHFRRGYGKHPRNDRRLETLRNELLAQVRALESFSASVTIQETDYQTNLGSPEQKIDVRKLIRGYDVAGNENDVPVEVFAPALRVLRAAKYRAGEHWSVRLPRPFITVHAGEDYSHLLCGLRSMDEAVEFCQLSEGDRIGHGLALGVDVYDWAKRQRRAYITAGQHLDNLVWAYHQAVLLSQHTVEHIPVMHELRDKIHYWSQLLHEDIYTPDLLYRAWLLRRNWPDYSFLETEIATQQEWVPDWNMFACEGQNPLTKVTAKKLWERYLDSDKNPSVNRIISVNCLPGDTESFVAHTCDDEDIISPGELRLYEAIQDYLIEKYSRIGLVIEACPTSNIYIGRFEKYHEHPLFRWNPPNPEWLKPGDKFNKYGLRSGPLSVCLNTDDSALMPTTIANEHRLMRECTIQHFAIGAWMADLWIDSIRQKGISIFEANHIKQDRR